MKPIAKKIFSLIPENKTGLTVAEVCGLVSASASAIRQAFETLEQSGRIKLIRRGKGRRLFAVRIHHDVLSCAMCRREFVRLKQSNRVTCSRPCAISMGWARASPERRAERCAALSASQSTPKAKARTAAHNKKRWADPEQHRKLSEQNRRRWKDPEQNAIVSAKIRLNHRKPEVRKFYSDMRTENWKDPAFREKTTNGIRRSKQSKEAREKFSKLLKDRWADPILRAKYTEANKKRNTPELRDAASKRMKAYHAAKRIKKTREVHAS